MSAGAHPGDYGFAVPDVQSLARDQSPFAVRTETVEVELAAGVTFRAAPVELGAGRFSNMFELCIDNSTAWICAESDIEGFFLKDLLRDNADIAAVTGAFSFSSDYPDYRPPEPCFDLCVRQGVVVSLPTSNKPAYVSTTRGARIGTVPANGLVEAAGRIFRWAGSKTVADPDVWIRAGGVVVFGASNCRIDYAMAARTGFVRHVDSAENVTPADSGCVDCAVVVRDGTHRIAQVRAGGGLDYFSGNYVLRADRSWESVLTPGTAIQILTIGELDVPDLISGLSIGPSVGSAARGDCEGYDESLGVSPFRDARYARSFLYSDAGLTRLRVYDGAPLTHFFEGLSPSEAAAVMAHEKIPVDDIYYLDGGQSSKIAFRADTSTRIVGSMHYLRWPSVSGEPFVWRGPEGRRLNSAFVVRARL
ncbi:hypothetical protein ABZ319_34910 [Nocardia sp. NPDC005978]|uniref:hypothetical protein n=1 Tax=Nocardia sp. NPDC005978 TaxID=3156725 RepID=UPI00339F27B6